MDVRAALPDERREEEKMPDLNMEAEDGSQVKDGPQVLVLDTGWLTHRLADDGDNPQPVRGPGGVGGAFISMYKEL